MLYGDVQVTLSIGEGVAAVARSSRAADGRIRDGYATSSEAVPMRYETAGESHGRALVALVTGVPAGLPVDVAAIDADLARRQAGYGRGGRQAIERDRALVLSGVRGGRTIGSPVALTDREPRLGELDRRHVARRRAAAGAPR